MLIHKPYVTPQEFGAAYNGTTDDSAAIEAAINYVIANPDTFVYFPPGAGCAVTRTIVVPPNVILRMDGPILYSGSADITALQIGTASAYTQMNEYKLDVKRKTISSWTSESSIGIKLINMEACRVNVAEVNGFTIGVQCIGDTKGFVYNQIELGQIINNKIGVDCTNRQSGWCNENLFLNGEFTQWSTTNTGMDRYGVRITSQDGSYKDNNNNFFIKPSFELEKQYIGAKEAIPVIIEYGKQNEFISCRNEYNSITFARILNQSTENAFATGYGELAINNIEDKSLFPLTYVQNRRRNYKQMANNLIFESGPLQKTACYYDGSVNVNVPGVNVARNSTSTVEKSGLMTLADNYLELSKSAIGIFADTHAIRRFVLKKDAETGYGGRVVVICYDANGNIVAGGTTNPLVKGASFASFYLSTQLFGGGSVGGYTTGSDSDDDLYFTVDPSVKRIRVLVSPGTNPLRLRSFALYTLDGHTTTWTGYEEIIPGVNLGITAPTAGTWPKGQLILNDSKTELGSPGSKYVIEGWECIAPPNVWIQKRMLTGK